MKKGNVRYRTDFVRQRTSSQSGKAYNQYLRVVLPNAAMKLTWTFYPKGESESVTLTVVYVPELDQFNLPNGGYLAINSNTAYVDWDTYKRFDTSDIEGRRDAFRRLTHISKSSGIIIKGTSLTFNQESGTIDPQ